MLCQKEPQEDWWGGEGGTKGNIVSEVGSIPPHPTLIPPGNKEIFCRYTKYSFVRILQIYVLFIFVVNEN